MRFMEHLPCFSPAFGGFGVVWRSKRGESISRLEGLGLFGAPNVGKFSGICCRATFDAYVHRSVIMELCCCIFI